MRNPQLPAPRALQLAHQDRLHGLRAPVLAVLPTAPFGPAHAKEVRRAQARPLIPLVGETLNQVWPVTVALLKVTRQPAQDAAKDMAGQVQAMHAGPDQEPAQAHDPIQVRSSPLVVPADPALARRNPQRGGGKSRRTEPAVRRADEVADLAARKSRHPVRMLARNQRVPQRPVRSVRDHDDLKVAYPRRMRRHLFRCGDIRLELARPVPDRRRARRRKGNARNPLGQCAQRLHAAGKLRASAHVEKRELLADPPAQVAAAVELFLRQDGRYPRNRRLVAQCAADL